MNKHRWHAVGLTTAGVVAGGIMAATLGANAADEANKSDVVTMSDGPHHGRVHFAAGPGSDDLAKELGVSEEKLRAAFEAIHDDVRPQAGRGPQRGERPPGPPSEAEMKAMHDKMTAALAKELGISQSKVEAAFEKQRSEARADHRENLSERLDGAVDDGKLTAADKKSVLKAFDAGVLEGGPHMMVVRRG
jgi:hypothetical protein